MSQPILDMSKPRCLWAGQNPLMVSYHDTEWGVPLHDDRKLFEFLVLESAQAGLSWQTVLTKRENYRAAFDYFDPKKVAAYTPADVERLLGNAGIIRNRLKIEATIINARKFLETQAEFGTFDRFIWQFTDGKTRLNALQVQSDIPAFTSESDIMSKELRRRGFKFVGTTICYAQMQATGMVNDHLVSCFRYHEVGQETH
jgi:DNA-3-methyladenine glycosylase I